MFPRQFPLAALLAAGVALSACNDNTTNPGSSTVRFVNAIPAAGVLNFAANNQSAGTNVDFQQFTACLPTATGNTQFSYGVTGGPTLFTTNNISLRSGRRYTVVATGTTGAPSALVLNDSFSTPATGRSLLRVVNSIPGSGSVDVYVTAVGAPISTAVLAQAGVGENQQVNFINVAAGSNQEVQLTTAGTTNVIATSAPLTFTDQGFQTLIFTGPTTGGTTNTSVLVPGCP